MKLLRKLGATSQIFQIFIADTSSTIGAGLTGLVFNSSSLTAYYHRDTDTTATAISLVTMTVGTFTSSGFKEIDATNMPGWYQFCPPNAALTSGASSCSFHLKGAANMAPLPLEVDLDGQVDITSWNGTAVSSPATAGIPDVNVKNISNLVATGNAAFGPVWDVVRSSHTTSGTYGGDTVTPPTNFSSMAINGSGNVSVDGTKTFTESYASANANPTLAQILYEIRALLAENTVSSTTVTTKKIDGSTTAHTYTINSATVPTSITTAS